MKNYWKNKKMPSLKVRRLRSIAIEMFKIIHKESPIYLHDLVNIKNIIIPLDMKTQLMYHL